MTQADEAASTRATIVLLELETLLTQIGTGLVNLLAQLGGGLGTVVEGANAMDQNGQDNGGDQGDE